MDNFKAIYRILHYLEQAMDYDEPDMDRISSQALGLTENRWESLMETLVSEGYVDGIKIRRFVDGYVEMCMINPRITLKGLEYLKENSSMKKIANLAKGIADFIP